MKYWTILCFSCLSIWVTAQINQTDSKGRKQGIWQKNYPNSKVPMYVGEFKDNQPIGEFKYYYPSNKVKSVVKHGPNGRSEAFYYHENGEIMTYGIYRNQKKDSLWFYFNDHGKVTYTEQYLNDQLHGKKTVYYPPNKETGKVERIYSVTYFERGKPEGEYIEYFDFGQTRVKGQYVNGLRHGEWTEYQPNGKPIVLNRYFKGEKHGWCLAFDANGKETNRVYYYYGKLKEGKELERLMQQMKEKGIHPNEGK